MIVIAVALATFVSTLVGGLCALRFKDKLHLILGFSAGAVIAVALFDLLPESADLGASFYSLKTLTAVVASGFLLYLMLDRLVSIHAHRHEQDETSEALRRGALGAGSLSAHSFLDGLAIGLAFQVSAAVGAVVAIAVLTHDFSDGINTVSFVLKSGGERRTAFRWLLVDAFAPVFGAASTLFFSLPEQALSIVLALFCGFFLYIGASDLIPESYHAHPKFLTTVMTVLGVVVLYLAIAFANL